MEDQSRIDFLATVEADMSVRPDSLDYWNTVLETQSRAQLEAGQSRKLRLVYRYLYQNSNYYRTVFSKHGLDINSIKDLSDLHKVPITRKTDWSQNFLAHPPWGDFSPLSDANWHDKQWMVFSTSGTTTQPRLFRHTQHDRKVWAWLNARALHSYGVTRGDLAFNCFNYGSSVAAWGMHEGLGLCGCAVVAAGALASERRAHLAIELKPQVILGTPSGLLSLARRIQELNSSPQDIGVRILLCAGEAGGAVASTRKRLSECWGAAVHDDFGCTEVAMGPLGYTCQKEARADSGDISVHLMEDSMIVEVLDPVSLQPVRPGEYGSLVVSNLYSESSPFLRFDMGDWVKLNTDPCACGRTHHRVDGGLLGRNDHCLVIKGLQFFPSTFEHAVRSIPELSDEYQITVESVTGRSNKDQVSVTVERSTDCSITEQRAEALLRAKLGITVNVQLKEPGSLPRTEGKGRRFFDRRIPALNSAPRAVVI